MNDQNVENAITGIENTLAGLSIDEYKRLRDLEMSLRIGGKTVETPSTMERPCVNCEKKLNTPDEGFNIGGDVWVCDNCMVTKRGYERGYDRR